MITASRVRVLVTLLMLVGLGAAQTTLPVVVPLSNARVDLLLAAILYFAFNSPTVEGAFLSLCAGYLQDLHASTPDFTHAFLAVLVFVIFRLVNAVLHVEGGWRAAAVAFAATLAHVLLKALLLDLVTTGPGEEGFLARALGDALPYAALTALVAPVVFRLLGGIEARWSSAPQGIL